MKILVVGDSYYGSADFRTGLAPLTEQHDIEFIDVTPDGGFQPRNESERHLTEYEGNPDQLVAALTDHEILVVHGAPVTVDVLRASPRLKLVCCARGGPVNVDLEAARELGIEVTNTPGKNAPAVAELAIALSVMLIRAVGPAGAFLRKGNRLLSAFDGAEFFGSELSGVHIGLVGFGYVAREVCTRALALGMTVSAYDPYVDVHSIEQAGASVADLVGLVSGCDIVSLHARQTLDNRDLVDAELLAQFQPGSYLINTAREGLVDETAVMDALRSGHLAGVAVDVLHDEGPFTDAIKSGEERLIALPHIGGATRETHQRASGMIIERIEELESVTR